MERGKGMKKLHLGKRMLSFVMIIAMVITMLPSIITSVSAAETQSMTIHWQQPDNWDWTTPAIQYWGGDAVASGYNVDESREITEWSDKPYGYAMTSEADGWYSLTLTGTLDGFQIVDLGNPNGNNSGGSVYASAMKYCTSTDVYAVGSDWKNWYLDKECTTSIDTLVPTDAITASQITVHFENTDNWESVNLHTWSYVSTSWPGNAMKADANHTGWYTATVNWDGSTFNFICNGSGGQTGNLALTPDAATEEIWVCGKDGSVLESAPDSWAASYVETPDTPDSGKDEEEEALPYFTVHFYNIYDWGTPAIQYWGNDKVEVTDYDKIVHVDSWGKDVNVLTAEGDGWYKMTFKGDLTGLGFQFLDIDNPDSNTGGKGYVDTMKYTAGDKPTDLYCKWGKDTDYTPIWYLDKGYTTSIDTLVPADAVTETTITLHYKNTNDWSKVSLYMAQGGSWTAIPGYEQYGKWPGNVITAGADGWYTVSVTKDMSTLDFIYNNGEKEQTDNLYVVPEAAEEEYWIVDGTVYDYLPTTIVMHYYTEDFSTVNAYFAENEWKAITGYESADNWPGVEIKKDSKNANWYTFSIVTDQDPFKCIFNNGSDKQTDNIEFVPTQEREEHWVTGIKGSTVDSTKAPEGWVSSNDNYIEPADTTEYTRFALVEYQRNDNDYEDWNIYCWDSGYGKKTEKCSPAEVNGKQYIVFPVKESEADFTIGFCMRRSTDDNDWAEKDGSDHALTIPAGQSVVHAVFEEGKGITYVYPYNKGYEMRGADDEISFFYRDDSLVTTDEVASLENVKVVVNGKEHDMEYDEDTDRFVFTLSGAETGDYAYYYKIGDEKKLDLFNDRKTTYDGEECSVFTFKTFDNLGITAKLSSTSINYSQNSVVSVEFTGDDAANISQEEIGDITVDLEALGLGEQSIEPSLMEGTIACRDTVKPGTYSIPVTMTDIYGNIYKASARIVILENDEDTFDWDEAVIYFAVTDRFFDGNTANNTGIAGENDVDKTGSLSYHGGDFAGLEAKLDYLKELGVNTIWITPIVAQSDITTEKDGSTIESTGYHGYWASDFEKLNGHLGTEAEFSELISAVHDRGMKMMVDVVLNHSGYDSETNDVTGYFNNIIQDENGNYVAMIRDESNTITGDNVYDSLANLPDFVTENPDVRDQLIDWQTNWVEKYGIDYFRVDTVKHVNTETWEAFKNELTKINPDFKLIGEYSGGGSTTLDAYKGAMDSLLDFDFNDFAQNFVSGNISSVESLLEARNSRINNTSTTGAFLSSHDEDGLVYKLINQNGYSEEEALNLFKVASALQMTAKGQVVVYYGEEIGLYGADNYPYQTNRYDFDWDELEAQKTESDSMYNHYKTLLEIRNSYSKLLAKGTRNMIAESDEEGYDVFSRSYNGANLYVGLNINETAKTVSFEVKEAAGTVLTDLYNDKDYTVSDKQTVTVDIPAAKDGGTVILGIRPAVDDNPADEPSDDTTDKPADDSASTASETDITEGIDKRLASYKDTVETVSDDTRKLTNGDLSIEGDKKTLPEGAKFEAAKLTDKAANYAKAESALTTAKMTGKFVVYDINLRGADGVQLHKLDDYVTVTLPVPEGLTVSLSRTITAYRLEDDGSLTKCFTTIADGKLSFRTNHFSTFVFVEEDIPVSGGNEDPAQPEPASPTPAPAANDAPTALTSVKTGDTTDFAILIAIALLGVAFATGAFAYSRKKAM